MTKNANFKRRVRSRAAKTGETYTAALRHIRQQNASLKSDHPSTQNLTGVLASLCIAVAQSSVTSDPGNVAALRASGAALIGLMGQARAGGAKLVHFPEGALCWPSKRILSSTGPEDIGPADWSKCNWAVLREELEAIRQEARNLGLWVVIGAPHRLSGSQRPHNSLYVVSDQGDIVTRYDERMLSNTKISFMYTPGSVPVTFEIDGIRFGCALGMEAHYPEIFALYEQRDVDCVLFSSTGGAPSDQTFATEVCGHAATNSFWSSMAIHAQPGVAAPSGIAAPDGSWAVQCQDDGTASIAIATISNDVGEIARDWRRRARAGLYSAHEAGDDPRSQSRDSF